MFSIRGRWGRCHKCDCGDFHGDVVYDAVLLGHNVPVIGLSFPDVPKECAATEISGTDCPWKRHRFPEERSLYLHISCILL